MKKLLYIVTAAGLLASCNPQATQKATEVAQTISTFDRSKAPLPSAAPTLNLQEPATFTLDNGLKVFVVENHKLPTVNTYLYFDTPAILEGDKAGMLGFYGDVMMAGTKNYTKEKLDEEIDFNGISLSTGSNFIFFNTMKKKLPEAMNLMTEVLFNPTFENQGELDKLKKQAITGIESSKKNSDFIIGRAAGALVYGTDHPYGEFETEETIKNIELNDLKTHYNTYFKPNIGYLTIVGDVTLAEAKKMASEFENWEEGEIPTFNYAEPKNIAQTEINIIDLPSATQSNISITNLEDLKKANNDYFGALLGTSVLGGSSSGRLFLNLREDKAYTYGAYSRLGENHKMKSRFNAFSKVRNEVTDSAVMAFYDEINSITSQPISNEDLQKFKNQRTGNFALGLEEPSTLGSFARAIELQDLDKDFYRNYLTNLNNQTPTTVLAAMKNYIKPNNQRIIIVGKAEDITPGLKKLGYPVKFFDMDGNEVADPTVKADTGDLSGKDVITKAIDALGGQDVLNNIKSINTNYDVTIPGVPMNVTANVKSMAPNKTALTMTAEGMGELMTQKFNGETGYTAQMGQKAEMKAEELEKAKAKNVIAEELSLLNNEDITLNNIVDVNGSKAYQIKVDKEERFYDVETGLLVKVSATKEVEENKITSISEYLDYKKVDGFNVPQTIKIDSGNGKTITMKLTSIEINKNVSDEDFQ